MKFRDAVISALTAVVVSAGTALAINPPFTTVWNQGYEALPSDTEQESLGASRIRDLKLQLRERLSQDHSWNGDGNDGYHKWVTLLQQTNAPIPAFDANATGGVLYTENVSGNDELLYADNNGHTTQLTNNGGTPQVVPSGTVLYTASPNTPAGFLLGNGQAVSRTTYASLFNVLGTTYGGGDGTTTFNIPDCRARYVAGGDTNNASGRLTGLTGGVNASVLGGTGGNQQFTVAANNLPSLPITITDPGHSHAFTGGSGAIQGLDPNVGGGNTWQTSGGNRGLVTMSGTGGATTGITAAINSVGANNPITAGLPPTIVFNCIVKTELDEKDAPQDFVPDTYAQADEFDHQGPTPALPGIGGLLERRSVIPSETRIV